MRPIKLPRWLVVSLIVVSAIALVAVPAWLWLEMPRRLAQAFLNAIESRQVDRSSEPDPPDATGVSIIQLIATPERYDGKSVRVIGFVRLEFEGNAIYLHHDDLKYGLTRNGIWLSVTDKIEKERDKYTDRYVLVEGTFNSQNKGHMGMNNGALENIRRFEVWEDLNSVP